MAVSSQLLQNLCADECVECNSCNFSKRLILIMDIYSKYNTQQTKSNIQEMITDELGYNVASLLNDYHHWKYNHLDETDDYQYLFEQISKCNVINCNIIRRNERKRILSHNDNTMQAKTSCNTENVALSEILDSIHSTMYHQYDLFKMLHPENITKSRDKTQKLLNTTDYEEISSFLKSRAPIIKQLRIDNDRNNKFVTKVISNNSHSKNHVETKENINILNNDDENNFFYDNIYPIYHFGFCYSSICCNEYHDHSEELHPKYKNLKEEILCNKIKNISLERWNIEYVKAKYIQQTDKSKSNIMLTRNIMSVLLYCNVDELQYHFSQAFRLKSATDSKQDATQRYIEFMRWTEKLRETVYKFGRINKSSFYHGISEQMIFEDASAYFYSPTSTTIDPVIAHYFSTNDGIIIKIDSTNNRCLDCSWLSDFEYEKEYLFMEGYIDNFAYEFEAKLRISGLIDCKTGIMFDEFLNAINFLNDTLFIKSPVSDHIITQKIRSINQQIDESTLSALELLLNFRLKNENKLLDLNDDDDVKMDKKKMNYICSIFDCYCNSKTEIIIDYEKYKYLTQLLIGNKNNTVDLRFFVDLFPNLETICFVEWSAFPLSCNNHRVILELISYGSKIKQISAIRGSFSGYITEKESYKSMKKLEKQLRSQLWTIYSYGRESLEHGRHGLFNTLTYGNNIHLKPLYTLTCLDSIYVYDAFVPIGSKYVLYKVNVCQDKEEKSISKRYSEFHRLYEQLRKTGYHSKCKFPSKIWVGPSNTEDVIKYRLCGLNNCIQEAFSSAKKQHNSQWLRYILVFAECYVKN